MTRPPTRAERRAARRAAPRGEGGPRVVAALPNDRVTVRRPAPRVGRGTVALTLLLAIGSMGYEFARAWPARPAPGALLVPAALACFALAFARGGHGAVTRVLLWLGLGLTIAGFTRGLLRLVG